MRPSGRVVLSLFAIALLAMSARASGASPPVLQELATRWSHVRDFNVTIEALEKSGKRTQTQLMRYEFHEPDRARIDLLDGPSRGAVVTWDGDNRATAYKRGLLSLFKIHTDPRDRRITSMRGNGVLTPDLGSLLSCFSAHRSNISEEPGPIVGGQQTEAVVLSYSGFACPHDSAADHAVTRDALYVARNSGLPVMRERFEGNSLVERWTLRDLQIHEGKISPGR